MNNNFNIELLKNDVSNKSIKEIIKVLGEKSMLGLSCKAYKTKDEELLKHHYKVLKEICKIPVSGVVVSYLSQGWIIECLERLQTNEYHKKALEELKNGSKVGAFCLTEPDHGSSYTNMKTIAKFDSEKYQIMGAKNYITNGYLAD